MCCFKHGTIPFQAADRLVVLGKYSSAKMSSPLKLEIISKCKLFMHFPLAAKDVCLCTGSALLAFVRCVNVRDGVCSNALWLRPAGNVLIPMTYDKDFL